MLQKRKLFELWGKLNCRKSWIKSNSNIIKISNQIQINNWSLNIKNELFKEKI